MTTSNRPGFFRSISASTIKPQKDKPRLYIALYPRGGSGFASNTNCDSQHWSLIVGPQTASKTDPGTRFNIAHLHGDQHQWFYEEQEMSTSTVAQTVLIRVTVGKVVDEARLKALIRDIPIPEDDPTFTCRTWVRNVYVKLIEDNSRCVKSYLSDEDWRGIEMCARKYCKRKRDQRRFTNLEGSWDPEKIPTFNFWEKRETTR